jgi:hypothetical protein
MCARSIEMYSSSTLRRKLLPHPFACYFGNPEVHAPAGRASCPLAEIYSLGRGASSFSEIHTSDHDMIEGP